MLIKILKQMMNPNTPEKSELIEYDCVFQLKNLVKHFYIRKGQITEGLLKKLDAIVVERPMNLEKKKEYFLDKNSQTLTLANHKLLELSL